MAFFSWFDSELYKNSWFYPELNKEAWFDSELINTPPAGVPTTVTLSLATLATVAVAQQNQLRVALPLATKQLVASVLQTRQAHNLALRAMTPWLANTWQTRQATNLTTKAIGSWVPIAIRQRLAVTLGQASLYLQGSTLSYLTIVPVIIVAYLRTRFSKFRQLLKTRKY